MAAFLFLLFHFSLFYIPQTHKKTLLPGILCRTGGIFHGAAVILLFVTVTPRASRTADTGSARTASAITSIT